VTSDTPDREGGGGDDTGIGLSSNFAYSPRKNRKDHTARPGLGQTEWKKKQERRAKSGVQKNSAVFQNPSDLRRRETDSHPTKSTPEKKIDKTKTVTSTLLKRPQPGIETERGQQERTKLGVGRGGEEATRESNFFVEPGTQLVYMSLPEYC